MSAANPLQRKPTTEEELDSLFERIKATREEHDTGDASGAGFMLMPFNNDNVRMGMRIRQTFPGKDEPNAEYMPPYCAQWIHTERQPDGSWREWVLGVGVFVQTNEEKPQEGTWYWRPCQIAKQQKDLPRHLVHHGTFIFAVTERFAEPTPILTPRA